MATDARRLYTLALSILRDEGEAEDAVQETLFRRGGRGPPSRRAITSAMADPCVLLTTAPAFAGIFALEGGHRSNSSRRPDRPVVRAPPRDHRRRPCVPPPVDQAAGLRSPSTTATATRSRNPPTSWDAGPALCVSMSRAGWPHCERSLAMLDIEPEVDRKLRALYDHIKTKEAAAEPRPDHGAGVSLAP